MNFGKVITSLWRNLIFFPSYSLLFFNDPYSPYFKLFGQHTSYLVLILSFTKEFGYHWKNCASLLGLCATRVVGQRGKIFLHFYAFQNIWVDWDTLVFFFFFFNFHDWVGWEITSLWQICRSNIVFRISQVIGPAVYLAAFCCGQTSANYSALTIL